MQAGCNKNEYNEYWAHKGKMSGMTEDIYINYGMCHGANQILKQNIREALKPKLDYMEP